MPLLPGAAPLARCTRGTDQANAERGRQTQRTEVLRDPDIAQGRTWGTRLGVERRQSQRIQGRHASVVFQVISRLSPRPAERKLRTVELGQRAGIGINGGLQVLGPGQAGSSHATRSRHERVVEFDPIRLPDRASVAIRRHPKRVPTQQIRREVHMMKAFIPWPGARLTAQDEHQSARPYGSYRQIG